MSDGLEYAGSAASLGGAGEKDFYRDEGTLWLFKPAVTKFGRRRSKPFCAAISQAWSEVAAMVLPYEHIPVVMVELRGQVGTLQPVLELDPQRPDLDDAEDRETLLREHVIDWLLSQHDSHVDNFIRRKADGQLLGIDKEQCCRYLGRDELSTSYAPNTRSYGMDPPLYNELWQRWAGGEYELDFGVVWRTIGLVEAIDSLAYEALVRPYAEQRHPESPLRARRLLEAILGRREGLRRDFEEFIGELQRRRAA